MQGPETNGRDARDGAQDAVIDMRIIDGLRELGGEDEPGLLVEIVALYLADAPKRLQEIDHALASGDLRALERAAHTLKSSSLNVGATGMAMLCRQMEELARRSEVSGVRILQDKGSRHWTEVERALRSLPS
jgi:HPt (histidine-containing phosphotransfer) domain-containing protein